MLKYIGYIELKSGNYVEIWRLATHFGSSAHRRADRVRAIEMSV
jgi:hypothetical protein